MLTGARFVLLALALALSAALGWVAQGWRTAGRLEAYQATQAQALARTQAAARDAEAAQLQTLKKAEDEAKQREIAIRRALADAGRARDGLRDELAAIRARADMPEAAPAALADDARRAADVLAQCVDEYRTVAGDADRLASDRQTLIEAWPR